MYIKPLKTPEEVMSAFDAFVELRTHLISKESFATQVMEQQKEGYEIVAIEEAGEIVACIGFRFLTTLAWGKELYVDDLITRKSHRNRGYAKILLDRVIQIGKECFCNSVHLDTGYQRHAAHKVYLKQGFEFHSHHLVLKLK